MFLNIRIGWKVQRLMLHLTNSNHSTPMEERWTKRGTVLKKKPDLVTFHKSIMVSLWTFQPTLIMNISYFYLENKKVLFYPYPHVQQPQPHPLSSQLIFKGFDNFWNNKPFYQAATKGTFKKLTDPRNFDLLRRNRKWNCYALAEFVEINGVYLKSFYKTGILFFPYLQFQNE